MKKFLKICLLAPLFGFVSMASALDKIVTFSNVESINHKLTTEQCKSIFVPVKIKVVDGKSPSDFMIGKSLKVTNYNEVEKKVVNNSNDKFVSWVGDATFMINGETFTSKIYSAAYGKKSEMVLHGTIFTKYCVATFTGKIDK